MSPIALEDFQLDFDTPTDPALQVWFTQLDYGLRSVLGMAGEQASAGLLDLASCRLALIHPDRIEYAASVAKIGILLAFFALNHSSNANLPPEALHDLGLMIKSSSNSMAAKYSRALGLVRIQSVLNDLGFYDRQHGGGLWVGKHYGQGSERIGDPIADHSHAATVRQVLRFYLLMEQGRLVSRAASRAMRDIFLSPAIPHDPIKFVKSLEGQPVVILRKWGSWEDWLHDSALVQGPGRHYILVALTRHPEGDAYLERIATAVDRKMRESV